MSRVFQETDHSHLQRNKTAAEQNIVMLKISAWKEKLKSHLCPNVENYLIWVLIETRVQKWSYIERNNK